MEELLNVLRKLDLKLDFEHEDNLVESGLLDSFEIVAIIDAIQEHFQIELAGSDIDPDNFGSAAAMWRMIEKYI